VSCVSGGEVWFWQPADQRALLSRKCMVSQFPAVKALLGYDGVVALSIDERLGSVGVRWGW